jgi:hypothetical protein
MSRLVLLMLVIRSCHCDGERGNAPEAEMDGHGSSESSWRSNWQIAVDLGARKSCGSVRAKTRTTATICRCRLRAGGTSGWAVTEGKEELSRDDAR